MTRIVGLAGFSSRPAVEFQTRNEPAQSVDAPFSAFYKARSAPDKKAKTRKVDPSSTPDEEKKPRNMWTREETMMLVNGYQIHGVGDWKTILQDPNLKFKAVISKIDSELTFPMHTGNIIPMPKLIFPTKFGPLYQKDPLSSTRHAANVEDLSPRPRMPMHSPTSINYLDNKPRTVLKKKTDGPVRAADDNLARITTAGPVRSRRRAQSRTGFLRGDT